jgi:hypothetical protein
MIGAQSLNYLDTIMYINVYILQCPLRYINNASDLMLYCSTIAQQITQKIVQ